MWRQGAVAILMLLIQGLFSKLTCPLITIPHHRPRNPSGILGPLRTTPELCDPKNGFRHPLYFPIKRFHPSRSSQTRISGTFPESCPEPLRSFSAQRPNPELEELLGGKMVGVGSFFRAPQFKLGLFREKQLF